MKKKLLVFLLFAGTTTSIYANWKLEFSDGIEMVDGAVYNASACVGAENTIALRPNPTNPYSFYYCDGWRMLTCIRYCQEGLAFDPTTLMCDFVYKVQPHYPSFPW